MKWQSILALGVALFAASPALAATVSILDPYLIRPDGLGNLKLKSFLAGNANLSGVTASALAEDGAAAGIVVVATDANSPVTLTVQNAGTLAPYTDNFLSQAPQAGSASLTVSKLWNIGGTYYAVALFQAPPVPLASQGQTVPAGITAMQDGSDQGAPPSISSCRRSSSCTACGATRRVLAAWNRISTAPDAGTRRTSIRSAIRNTSPSTPRPIR